MHDQACVFVCKPARSPSRPRAAAAAAFDGPLHSNAASFCVSLQVLTALSYRRLAEPRAVQRAQSSDSGG